MSQFMAQTLRYRELLESNFCESDLLMSLKLGHFENRPLPHDSTQPGRLITTDAVPQVQVVSKADNFKVQVPEGDPTPETNSASAAGC